MICGCFCLLLYFHFSQLLNCVNLINVNVVSSIHVAEQFI